MASGGILLIIILAGLFGPIILNPILYFIYFEIYERKQWISNAETLKDKRFFKCEFNREKGMDQYQQLLPVRPTIGDFWKEFREDYMEYWWCPLSGAFCTIGLTCYLIFKPFVKGIEKMFNTIKNIKI